jgi:hypothetical protein
VLTCLVSRLDESAEVDLDAVGGHARHIEVVVHLPDGRVSGGRAAKEGSASQRARRHFLMNEYEYSNDLQTR